MKEFGDYELLEEMAAAVRALFIALGRKSQRNVALKVIGLGLGEHASFETFSSGSGSGGALGTSGSLFPFTKSENATAPAYFSMKL